MITYHNMEQKSPEWFEAKKGLLSASKANCIRSNGSGLKTYGKMLALEELGYSSNNVYTPDMQRGDLLEPIARKAYEFETGDNVIEVGGITNSKYPGVWISPDGLISDCGGCESKARNDEKHFDLWTGGESEIPYDQIQMSLLISERKWWDFISYNPNFKEKSLFIKTIYPDPKTFIKLISGFKKGLEYKEYYINKFIGKNG